MASLPPRLPTDQSPSILRQFSRFARVDPQLYPLAVITLVTVGFGSYFLCLKPTKADSSMSRPMFPSKMKEEVERHEAEGRPVARDRAQ
ncbi:hypothetical protein OPQ81_011922 [Rhizoctonia solani]|nr:hypothetical protein OPQ81_011922 [Rhizoctonia solani]